VPIESAAPDGEAAESPAANGSAPVPAVSDEAEQAQGDHEAPAAEAVVAETDAVIAEAAEASPDGETVEVPSADAGGQPAVAEAAEVPTAEAADGHAPTTKPARAPRGDKAARRPSAPAGAGRDRRTTAQRLGNFPRADKPANIPAPEHHHLPGWVRRDFARARPPLSNILALLEGDAKEQYAQRINELTEGISAGRFSLAWQYPDLVDEGRALYEKQRRDGAESARANRQLDTARRRVQDRIRDAGDNLTADVAARLQRQLRSASDSAAINAVAAELDGVASAAKTSAEKRREREIERTRARIRRSASAGAGEATPQTETWQDVLRRFAEQQAAGSRSSE
jgi:hypothetical protein